MSETRAYQLLQGFRNTAREYELPMLVVSKAAGRLFQ